MELKPNTEAPSMMQVTVTTGILVPNFLVCVKDKGSMCVIVMQLY